MNKVRTCQDCPATIPINGGRKRCSTCQDKERLRQVAKRNAKRASRAKEPQKETTANV